MTVIHRCGLRPMLECSPPHDNMHIALDTATEPNVNTFSHPICNYVFQLLLTTSTNIISRVFAFGISTEVQFSLPARGVWGSEGEEVVQNIVEIVISKYTERDD